MEGVECFIPFDDVFDSSDDAAAFGASGTAYPSLSLPNLCRDVRQRVREILIGVIAVHKFRMGVDFKRCGE